MTVVTVFRHVPKPLIGTVSVVNDPNSAVLEDSLDWLETTGILVERFDPAVAPDEVAKRPEARRMLKDGERCLPLIFLDDVLILEGVIPSHTALAHAVGRARSTSRDPGAPAE